MPLLLPALSAVVAIQSPAQSPVDRVQGLVEAIPEALIAGKRGAMPGLVAKAKAGWEQAKPGLLKAKVMPEADATFIDRQVTAMLKMKPREQAMGALGISATLSRYQGRSRKQDLLQADRVAMMAWCGVDAGQWAPLPDVAGVFKPLLDQDQGQHTMAAIGIQDALKRFQDGTQKKQVAIAKKALKDLMIFVDVLEKP
jgi:hypothetical protein